MDEKKVYEKLNEIFRDIFDDDEIEVTAETTADDIEDWDSLIHINLLVSIESVFGVKFKMEEFNSMKNVGTMVELILQHLK